MDDSTSFTHLERETFVHFFLTEKLTPMGWTAFIQVLPDSQLIAGLDFDWAILTHEFACI